MSRKLTRKEQLEKRKKNKQNKIKRMEYQDKVGISRKKVFGTMEAKTFVRLKIIAIISIPVCYILFSPLLILCCIFNVFLLFCSILTERKLNNSYIKENHITIFKLDCIVSLFVIIITLYVTITGNNVKMKFFSSDPLKVFLKKVESFGACLTGSRNIFQSNAPKTFASPSFTQAPVFDFSNVQIRPGKVGNAIPKKVIKNLNQMPFNFMFSTVISSINTILILILPVLNILCLYLFNNRNKKIKKEFEEVINDKFEMMSEDEIKRLFMFGLEIEE